MAEGFCCKCGEMWVVVFSVCISQASQQLNEKRKNQFVCVGEYGRIRLNFISYNFFLLLPGLF